MFEQINLLVSRQSFIARRSDVGQLLITSRQRMSALMSDDLSGTRQLMFLEEGGIKSVAVNLDALEVAELIVLRETTGPVSTVRVNILNL